jgi:hypothetical protein
MKLSDFQKVFKLLDYPLRKTQLHPFIPASVSTSRNSLPTLANMQFISTLTVAFMAVFAAQGAIAVRTPG